MTVIQLTVLTAVHEQLVPVMTDTALVDPVDGTETLVGVTVALVHCADAVRTSSDNASTTSIQNVRRIENLELKNLEMHIPRPGEGLIWQ